jgi:hypothetical protein
LIRGNDFLFFRAFGSYLHDLAQCEVGDFDFVGRGCAIYAGELFVIALAVKVSIHNFTTFASEACEAMRACNCWECVGIRSDLWKFMMERCWIFADVSMNQS